MTYNHLVEFNDQSRQVTIYRIYENGNKELFTYIDLPPITAIKNEFEFKEFCLSLSENMLLDSPIARKLFNL